MSLQLLPIELPEDLEYADLVVLSDMHVGDPLFDEQLFFRVRDWVLAEPNRYVICNGDLMNTATKDSVSDVYRETLNPSDQLRWLKKELAALRDRILCITEGNHEARITRATSINVLEQLAESLGLADRYHPEGVLLKITLGRHRKHKKRVCYTIYVTHGRGGGALGRQGAANGEARKHRRRRRVHHGAYALESRFQRGRIRPGYNNRVPPC